MFTGLIQRTGRIRRVSHGRGLVVEIEFPPWPEPLERGESVAVNGVCLTVADCGTGRFTAHVLDETAARSGLGEARPGVKVNLERALRAGDRMGGHIVQGHVDGRGKILARIPKGRDIALRISCGAAISAATVPKGSVAVDGVSLTVSAAGDGWIQTDIIPTTASETTLGSLKEGDWVNLESDVLGRYAIKSAPPAESGLTMETLVENGFA